tara:strand:- start:110 stop:640 length:531 start_codon:yes stop_codon:yes gene_type:complete
MENVTSAVNRIAYARYKEFWMNTVDLIVNSEDEIGACCTTSSGREIIHLTITDKGQYPRLQGVTHRHHSPEFCQLMTEHPAMVNAEMDNNFLPIREGGKCPMYDHRVAQIPNIPGLRLILRFDWKQYDIAVPPELIKQVKLGAQIAGKLFITPSLETLRKGLSVPEEHFTSWKMFR